MPPFVDKAEVQAESEDALEKLVAPQAAPRKFQVVYRNLVTFGLAHLSALYGLYLAVTVAKWYSVFFCIFLAIVAGIGVTAGAHRLWTHRAYKAKMPLQIILIVMNSLAFQNSALDWIRDHRLHHRYSDTDADPHNATRGFFYSHIGWLLVRKHPEVKRRGKFVDLSDVYANPVLTFQKKYAIPFIGTICFLLPTVIPWYYWGESLYVAWYLTMLRYVYSLHVTFLVNSAAHLWGNKPYDKYIKPVQNLYVSFFAYGEGFHNYHHVFPWDYRTAELGNNWLNLSTLFIDFFAWVGWAYDLKTVPDDVISARAERTGDGANKWGFGPEEKGR
ncbi:acyl-CoA Delta(11) desaturase-like [Aricia agestis]|uniref:acyl-CoA Delta(11) desaturase-like n=1 Tax=Aricia agestis TaxID=91739 RepID=UPI001C204C80|nr:acyl-CoA Delta(11) desaturase-like [Aricia agestis]XP_041989099.1 acyl-CoA Delta(11) desaturase-like [Aricia agestis]XP_041989100.1 acyl-CoA Delta(11) desaturase-like [Aricia agestis]